MLEERTVAGLDGIALIFNSGFDVYPTTELMFKPVIVTTPVVMLYDPILSTSTIPDVSTTWRMLLDSLFLIEAGWEL